jgi:molecular chaperone GrpE (heat shock protein)
VNPDADSTRTEEESRGATNPDATETPEVRALKAELATEKDRCLRLAADFNNFRKRTAQESERRAASQKRAFIQELLPIIDNLELALSNGPSASRKQLLQGVDMTLQQLNRLGGWLCGVSTTLQRRSSFRGPARNSLQLRVN